MRRQLVRLLEVLPRLRTRAVLLQCEREERGAPRRCRAQA